MGSHWTPPDDQRGWRAQGDGAEEQEPAPPLRPPRGPLSPNTIPDFSSPCPTVLILLVVVGTLIVLTGLLAAVLFIR